MPERLLRFVALLVASWCVMTFTHEAGHIIGGWLSGGTLQAAELRPWRLPYSIFGPDPRPLITLWSGPLLGVILPLAVALLIRRSWAWFIADFCLLANGAYLTAAWFSGDGFLDTPRMIEAGASPVAIAIYCALTLGIGYIRFRRDCVHIFAHSGPDNRLS